MTNEQRQVLLEEKEREFQTQLTVWALANNILKPGEKLLFTLAIQVADLVVAKVQVPGLRLRTTLNSKFRQLTRAEWSSIFALPFSPPDLALLEIMQKNKCKAMTSEEIRSKFPPQHLFAKSVWCPRYGKGGGEAFFDWDSVRTRINRIFFSRGLPYCLRQISRKKHEDRRFTIAVTD